MKRLLTPLLQRVYVVATLFCLCYYTFQVAFHSPWNRERLYRKLVTGSLDDAPQAAATLAFLGGQEQLLRALKSDSEPVRGHAARALQTFWFTAAGDEASALTQAAQAAIEAKQFDRALTILDRLTTRFPHYAEGWNRRASVHWQLGQTEKSMADCYRVLSLNPDHYAAWQGLAVCQLKQGRLPDACYALRKALSIVPHDTKTKTFLVECERLLRIVPQTFLEPGPLDML